MAAKKYPPASRASDLGDLIHTVRGQKVILDADLAAVYGVTTKRLNEQYRRNLKRFPEDFAFSLTPSEWAAFRSQTAAVSPAQNLKPQIATSSFLHGGRRKLPVAFTEHGAIMAATVLNSPQAVQMSVFVVRAFIKMRAALTDTRALARKLTELEAELKSRLDVHEVAIVDILQRIMKVLDPPPAAPPAPEPPRPEIGFHIKEDRTPYRVRTAPNRNGGAR